MRLVSDTAKAVSQVHAWALNLFAMNSPDVYCMHRCELIFKIFNF